jgi:hypothetical protein
MKPLTSRATRLGREQSTALRAVVDLPAEQSALLTRAYRLRDYVRHLVVGLGLPGNWEFEAAAMLSHIGFLDLPRDTVVNLCAGGPLSEAERETLTSRAADGAALLRRLPRLRVVADIIGCQFKPYRDFTGELDFREPAVALGSQMLHAAGDLDRLLNDGVSQSDALERMLEHTLEYNPDLLSLLMTFDVTVGCGRCATRNGSSLARGRLQNCVQ